MAMLTFHTLFPDEADTGYGTVIPVSRAGLPKRPFCFVESYCVEPECDCRRVMLSVIDSETDEQVATINYGFEPPEPPFDDEPQWFLDPLNPQSKLSDSFLDLFEYMIEHDRSYHDRLVRHYEMWKRVVDDPAHPDQPTVRLAASGDGIPRHRQPLRRIAPRTGPNDPCPCGSGRKYKRCCRN
jgi:hypothetical protein